MELVYRVQLWPRGQWDGKPYRKVIAASPQEAAEKVYGKPLYARGSNSEIRAQVRDPQLNYSGIIFYGRWENEGDE